MTPLKTNKSPENWWLEDEMSILKWSLFRGHVSFREGTPQGTKISHLGERNIIDAKSTFGMGYVSSQLGIYLLVTCILPPIIYESGKMVLIVKETIVLEGPVLHFHDCGRKSMYIQLYLWSTPHPIRVTTRILRFLGSGNPNLNLHLWRLDPEARGVDPS